MVLQNNNNIEVKPINFNIFDMDYECVKSPMLLLGVAINTFVSIVTDYIIFKDDKSGDKSDIIIRKYLKCGGDILRLLYGVFILILSSPIGINSIHLYLH